MHGPNQSGPLNGKRSGTRACEICHPGRTIRPFAALFDLLSHCLCSLTLVQMCVLFLELTAYVYYFTAKACKHAVMAWLGCVKRQGACLSYYDRGWAEWSSLRYGNCEYNSHARVLSHSNLKRLIQQRFTL